MLQEALHLLQDQEGITNLERIIMGGALLILFLLFACGLLAPWSSQ